MVYVISTNWLRVVVLVRYAKNRKGVIFEISLWYLFLCENRYLQVITKFAILKTRLFGFLNFTKKAPYFLIWSAPLIPILQIKIFAVLIPSWYFTYLEHNLQYYSIQGVSLMWCINTWYLSVSLCEPFRFFSWRFNNVT